jgi:probable O-glycosylation ligase (exosortase A-associated)
MTVKMATNLVLDRPSGGDFNASVRWFAVYAPDARSRDVHSIYFEVLGEHGFPGLVLFLVLIGFTWRTCSRINRRAKRHEETLWLSELARMVQVALSGYAVTGAFLGMAYFDLYYNLIIIVVVGKFLLQEHVAMEESEPVARPRLAARWARAQ